MAWPNTRLTTYTPASPVKSADLNAIQDAIIGGKCGDINVSFPAAASFTAETAQLANVALAAAPVRLQFNAAAILWFPIPLRVGDRLKTVTIAAIGNGVADLTVCTVRKTTKAGVDTIIGDIAPQNNLPAAYADYVIDVNPDYTLVDGDSITLGITSNAAGISLGTIRYTYDHP